MSYLNRIQHEGLGARDGLYSCSGITVFDGPLGAGKTLALRAVELAMTGKSRDVSTIGQLRTTLARATGTQQMASIEIDETKIKREWAKSESVELDPPAPGVGKGVKLHQFWVDQNIGGPPVTADLLEVNDLSPEKFNAWILQKIGAEETDVADAMRSVIDDETADTAVIAAIEKLLESNRQGKLSASEYIQHLEEKARGQRNATIALLKDAEASRRESARHAGGTTAIAQTIADLQTKLDVAKAEHEATVKMLGEQEERAERIWAINIRIAKADEKLETLQGIPEDWNPEQKQADAKRILAEINFYQGVAANVRRGVQTEGECEKRVKSGRDAIAQFFADSLERGQTLLEEDESDLKEAVDRVLALMQREMTRCPKCKHEFHEKSLEQELETAIQARIQAETRHRDRLAHVEQEIQVPGDYFLNDKELLRLQSVRKQLVKDEAELQNIRTNLDKARELEGEAKQKVIALLIEVLGDSYAPERDVVEQAEEAKKSWDAIQASLQSREQTRNQKQVDEQELAGLATCNLQDLRDLEAAQKQAVQNLEAAISEQQRYLAAAQNEAHADERILKLTAQIEIEKLVVEIVQSVRQEIVDGALQGLLGACNRMLDGWGEIAIQNGSFVLQNQSGTRQWAALSSGERAFTGIAIAAAFAEKRGPQKLQCISVDNAECVGQEQLMSLLYLCHRIWEQFRVQVLLAGHFDGAQLQRLDIQDLTIHDLRETVTA